MKLYSVQVALNIYKMIVATDLLMIYFNVLHQVELTTIKVYTLTWRNYKMKWGNIWYLMFVFIVVFMYNNHAFTIQEMQINSFKIFIYIYIFKLKVLKNIKLFKIGINSYT